MTNNELIRGNPIKTQSEDLLDRSSISENLSRLICNDSQKECCTIGISGPWGCGKTSIINMLRDNIGKTRKNIIFIDFCPIDYQTNAEGIARIFFDVLISRLEKIRKDNSNLVSKYGLNKAKVAKNIADTAVDAVFTPNDIRSIIKDIEILSKAIVNPAKYDPIETVRSKISIMLTDAKIKLVIIIDDLDRLMPGEATQILKLIRITAHFDNVYYILGYDETVLSKQIDDEMGSQYLEKFIQVPVHLPEVNGNLLQSMLYSHLVDILKRHGYEPNDCTTNVCKAINLTTMRDLFLLLNRFGFKFDMCPEDICPEDLLALTYVEMKDLGLYGWFFENRFGLCKMKSPFMRDNEVEDPNNHDFDLLREYAGRKIEPCLKKAVTFMYPHIDKNYYEFTDPTVRKDRIRLFYSCSTYFILNESSIPVSNSQVDLIIDADNNGEALYTMLMDMATSKRGNVNLLLDKVNERIHELPPLDAGTIAKVLIYDIEDQDFCELLPYGPRNSSSWQKLLDEIFRMMGDDLIRQFFVLESNYKNPYAVTMAFEYLRELEGRLSMGESIPMSEECLSEYVDAIRNLLVELAPDFERNDNEERSRMFFAHLGLVDENLAKSIFDRVFDTDDDVITYLCRNFNPNFVLPGSVGEIVKYISEQRIPKLAEKTEGAIRNMLLGAADYNARKLSEMDVTDKKNG